MARGRFRRRPSRPRSRLCWTAMPKKRYRPEEIVAKLRQVDVLVSHVAEITNLGSNYRPARRRSCKASPAINLRSAIPASAGPSIHS